MSEPRKQHNYSTTHHNPAPFASGRDLARPRARELEAQARRFLHAELRGARAAAVHVQLLQVHLGSSQVRSRLQRCHEQVLLSAIQLNAFSSEYSRSDAQRSGQKTVDSTRRHQRIVIINN